LYKGFVLHKEEILPFYFYFLLSCWVEWLGGKREEAENISYPMGDLEKQKNLILYNMGYNAYLKK
jgi:hypothetical protein